MKLKIWIILGLLIIIGVVSLSFFTVNENEYVIVTFFGDPTRVITEPGLGMKLPGFIQTVNRIDKRVGVFKTLPIQLLLGDKNPIIITCYVAWQVSDPLKFFQSLTFVDVARQKLSDMVTSQLGSVLGDYTLDDIINVKTDQIKLHEIENKIKDNCNLRAPEQYGVKVVKMGFRRINYPSIVAEAVYNRMRAEREKEAKKYRAEGTEEAAKIEAETDRKVSEILSNAYREAEIIKGEGDRDAMKIYAEAYEQDRKFFEFMESMKTYEKILKNKSTIVLSTDSELFKYLNSDGIGAE